MNNKTDQCVPIIKNASTKLAKNIQVILPLIEEITEAALIPLCLIGFQASAKDGKVFARFATISDDPATKAVLIKCCKELIEAEENDMQNDHLPH